MVDIIQMLILATDMQRQQFYLTQFQVGSIQPSKSF